MATDAKKAARIKEVQELMDAFSQKHLTPELADYVRKLWEQIGRKRNFVITGGKPEIWASAVVYVIARINFLFDRSNPHYLTPDVICDFFGTKKTTVSTKATQIEKTCQIRLGQEGLCSPDLSDSFTFVQLPNGMVLTKKMAKEMGFLPPPRHEKKEDAAPARGWVKEPAVPPAAGMVHLYTLEVSIISGPIAKSFIQKNKVIARTIQIRGDQTLQDLHYAIFEAFDREEQHMYEFQIGGKRPMDPKARRYVLPSALMQDLGPERKPAGDVKHTTIESLGLKVGGAFGYWFDFGDDWWHQINVRAIEETSHHGAFPKVIQRIGESPPQYPDWDRIDE
jgi:hypothetical protein